MKYRPKVAAVDAT